MSSATKTITIPEEQAEYIEENNLKLSQLAQDSIEEHRRAEPYQQLNITKDLTTLAISLRNSPMVRDTRERPDGQGLPIRLWEDPEGDGLTDEYPVNEVETKWDDVTLWKRKDNGSVCGVEIDNWDEHEDLSLIFPKKGDKNPSVSLDPPKR